MILMMSAKLAAPGLLKTMVFWNKGYEIINPVHDVTNKILSHDSNHIIDAVMWPNFGSSSIYMREVMITSIYKDLTRKTAFLRGGLGYREKTSREAFLPPPTCIQRWNNMETVVSKSLQRGRNVVTWNTRGVFVELKLMKNVFYFMLKTLFVLEVFTFFILTFRFCRKTDW